MLFINFSMHFLHESDTYIVNSRVLSMINALASISGIMNSFLPLTPNDTVACIILLITITLQSTLYLLLLISFFSWSAENVSFYKKIDFTSTQFLCITYIMFIFIYLTIGWILKISCMFNKSFVWQSIPIEYIIAYTYMEVVFVLCLNVLTMTAVREEFVLTKDALDAKRLFVRYISHELRTPMNIALNGCKYLKENTDEKLEPDKMDTIIDVVDSCVAVVRILDGILFIDKMETDSVELNYIDIPVVEFMNEAMKPFYSQARHSEIDLKLCIVREIPRRRLCDCTITIDKLKMLQVMQDIMTNALRFTSKGGNITVHVSLLGTPIRGHGLRTRGSFTSLRNFHPGPRRASRVGAWLHSPTPATVIAGSTNHITNSHSSTPLFIPSIRPYPQSTITNISRIRRLVSTGDLSVSRHVPMVGNDRIVPQLTVTISDNISVLHSSLPESSSSLLPVNLSRGRVRRIASVENISISERLTRSDDNRNSDLDSSLQRSFLIPTSTTLQHQHSLGPSELQHEELVTQNSNNVPNNTNNNNENRIHRFISDGDVHISSSPQLPPPRIMRQQSESAVNRRPFVRRSSSASRSNASVGTGSVTEGAKFEGEYIRIMVTDTGVGISKENQMKLFKEVAQFQNINVENGQGAGLGLFISKGIMDLHGGKIGVISEGEGHGSSFYIEIGLKTAATVTSAAMSTNPGQDLLEDDEMESVSDDEVSNDDSDPVDPRNSSNSNRGNISESQTSRNHEIIEVVEVVEVVGVDTIEDKIIGNANTSPRKSIPQQCYSSIRKLDSEFDTMTDVTRHEHLSDSNSKQLYTDSNSFQQIPSNKKLSNIIISNNNTDNNSNTNQNMEQITSNKITNVVIHPSTKLTEVPSLSPHGNISDDSVMDFDATDMDEDVKEGKQELVEEQIILAQPSIHAISKPSKPRILVVDDSPTNLKMMVRMLTSRADTIIQAEDGAIAYALVKRSIDSGSQPFHAVLMDYMMPNMDGPTAAKAMRDWGYTGLIIGITGNALESDINTYKIKGADEVLLKPLDLDALDSIMKDWREERPVTYGWSTITKMFHHSVS